MDRLRVGLFTECYRPIVNGVVGSIDGLRAGLRDAGHDVVCVAPRFPSYEDAEEGVVRLPSLPLPTPTGYRLCLPVLDRDRERRIGPLSVVHTHSPFVTGWVGRRFARRHRVPHVHTYHTRLEAYAHYVPFERTLTERAAIELTRAYANATSAVVVPTPAMERRLREVGVTVPIAVVPSAIDVERFTRGRRRPEIRAQLGCGGAERLVLAVARLGREKNLELVLRAAALFPAAVRVAIVGDGPERGRLESLAAALGVAERVTFAGAYEQPALPDVYASADAFLFTSLTETQGLVLVEAMTAGLPIVAVDSGASRDVLGPGVALVPPEPAALAAAVEATLHASDGAKQLAPRGYTVRTQAERILELYAGLGAAGIA